MVTINGEQVNADGLTVSQYLEQEKLTPERVAVMLRNDILPKNKYDRTVLSDGDELTAARVMVCAGHQASKAIELILSRE